MLGFDFFFAVAAKRAGGDLAVGFDEEVDGVFEEGAFLDVVVGDETEGAGLGVGGGFVVEGAVFEVENDLKRDALAVGDLDEVAVAEDLAAGGADDEEAVLGALRKLDGDGVGVEGCGAE